MITACTPKIPKEEREQFKETVGLGSSHAYTVLRVIDIPELELKLVKLRNPNIGKFKWKGDWSESSALWTDELKSLVGYNVQEKGVFFMSDTDFYQ